jgi:hypothetical protein
MQPLQTAPLCSSIFVQYITPLYCYRGVKITIDRPFSFHIEKISNPGIIEPGQASDLDSDPFRVSTFGAPAKDVNT